MKYSIAKICALFIIVPFHQLAMLTKTHCHYHYRYKKSCQYKIFKNCGKMQHLLTLKHLPHNWNLTDWLIIIVWTEEKNERINKRSALSTFFSYLHRIISSRTIGYIYILDCISYIVVNTSNTINNPWNTYADTIRKSIPLWIF